MAAFLNFKSFGWAEHWLTKSKRFLFFATIFWFKVVRNLRKKSDVIHAVLFPLYKQSKRPANQKHFGCFDLPIPVSYIFLEPSAFTQKSTVTRSLLF